MTLSIELPPEFERTLEAQSRKRGLAPAEYAKQLLQEQLVVHNSANVTSVDFEEALNDFFNANPETVPGLPADFSREDIYIDHD
jgi:hypothetical protein